MVGDATSADKYLDAFRKCDSTLCIADSIIASMELEVKELRKADSLSDARNNTLHQLNLIHQQENSRLEYDLRVMTDDYNKEVRRKKKWRGISAILVSILIIENVIVFGF